MKATVYTQPGCPNCETEITLLKADGYEVEVIDAGGIAQGVPLGMDIAEAREVMSQLAMQNGAFPVVRIGGEFKRRNG